MKSETWLRARTIEHADGGLWVALDDALEAAAPDRADPERRAEGLEALTRFEMAEWPGQDFLLYEDVAALVAALTPPPAGNEEPEGEGMNRLMSALTEDAVRQRRKALASPPAGNEPSGGAS